MSLENLKLLTERPNENLRELSFESAFIYSKSKDLSRSICEKAVFELLSTLPPTLKELTVKNFKSSPTQNYNLWTPLTSSTCQNLTYLDISGSSAILAKPHPTSLSGYSNLAYYNNLRSIGEFLNRFNLQNLQELNIFNTSLTGTFEDVGNARTEQDVHRLRSGCRKGPLTSQHPSFSSRNFYTKPLRVNAKDGHRLRESVTLKCAICHVAIAEDVRSYMKAPPHQGHVSYEILFDFVSPDCTPLPLDDLTFKSVRLRDMLPAESIPPGVSEEMLNQRQVMINCRNNCHEVKDQFLIAGQDGFMVDTRDYKYSAAVGEGLCYEAD
ncbi:hypothetical protein TL16_g06884 [Triparma laevis f. inornata]|uniref:Uncharacterized protein n=2 Tax=Triparma laevis TaxID=1534972 RepID=A0A9W7FT03_9STRA|nr:hypothetical protein TL16_g06884 [Triparma laevis f. inornata]GMI17610.1 hypothetical protein TrLO_g4432 [Triparma laevis f. longispina]